MFEIKKATNKHIPKLKEIWNICFGDDMKYIDFFFNNRFSTCECVIAVNHEDIPIAAMYLLPVTAFEYGKSKRGFYVYAIGVIPKYRGTGIYKKMHSMLREYLIQHNMFCILCPANSKLCEYYKTLGFIENAYVNEICIQKNNTPKNYTLKQLDAKTYYKLRNSYFNSPIYWDENALDYVLRENEFTHGVNLMIKDNEDNEYFALVRNNTVTESNIPPEKMEEMTNYLCSLMSKDKLTWITECRDDNEKILLGLSCNLKKDNYYLNLILN